MCTAAYPKPARQDVAGWRVDSWNCINDDIIRNSWHDIIRNSWHKAMGLRFPWLEDEAQVDKEEELDFLALH